MQHSLQTLPDLTYFCHSTYSCSYLCKLPYDKKWMFSTEKYRQFLQVRAAQCHSHVQRTHKPLMCPLWKILSSTPGISPEIKDFADLLYEPSIENLSVFVHVLGGLPTTQKGSDFPDIASGNYSNLLPAKTNLQELQKKPVKIAPLACNNRINS